MCKKKAENKKLIPQRLFSLETLPEGQRDGDLYKLILSMAEWTGRIDVKLPSGKPRNGAGFVQRIRTNRGQCACHECKDGSRKNVFAILTVTTVVRVFSKKESDEHKRLQIVSKPGDVTMWLRFDSDERKLGTEKTNAKKVHGCRFLEMDKHVDEKMDWCCVGFVTHGMDLASELGQTLTEYQELQERVYKTFEDAENVNLVVINVGHPRGGEKRISWGKKSADQPEILKVIRDTQRWGRYHYDTPTCRGMSGAPVLILGQRISGFGYWFGHPHNHAAFSKRKQISISSIGVEHIDSI